MGISNKRTAGVEDKARLRRLQYKRQRQEVERFICRAVLESAKHDPEIDDGDAQIPQSEQASTLNRQAMM